jgi:hypothetical protein
MSITLSQGLPANVVEIGTEVTQAKIDEINSGTLALQTWVTLGFAPKASPTFTGTVTIPAGASISGYLTTSSASSTYQTIAGMSSYATQTYVTTRGYITSSALSGYATESFVYMQNYLTDAPSDGNEYVRKNAAWAVATGGGGGGISDAPSDGVAYARKDAAWYSLADYATQTWINTQNFLTAKTVQACPTTFGAGDQNKINHFVPAMGGSTIYVPADSTYAFPNGTEIVIVSDYSAGGTSNIAGQYAGQPTINGAWSVNMSANVSKLVKIGTDIWFYT